VVTAIPVSMSSMYLPRKYDAVEIEMMTNSAIKMLESTASSYRMMVSKTVKNTVETNPYEISDGKLPPNMIKMAPKAAINRLITVMMIRVMTAAIAPRIAKNEVSMRKMRIVTTMK
jgi:hypothetical protein